jgi:hypothetical protein
LIAEGDKDSMRSRHSITGMATIRHKRAISPQVIQAERIINQLCAAPLGRSLDHLPSIQVIENERRIEMRVEKVSRQDLQMVYFVANRCHIPTSAKPKCQAKTDAIRSAAATFLKREGVVQI